MVFLCNFFCSSHCTAQQELSVVSGTLSELQRAC